MKLFKKGLKTFSRPKIQLQDNMTITTPASTLKKNLFHFNSSGQLYKDSTKKSLIISNQRKMLFITFGKIWGSLEPSTEEFKDSTATQNEMVSS